MAPLHVLVVPSKWPVQWVSWYLGENERESLSNYMETPQMCIIPRYWRKDISILEIFSSKGGLIHFGVPYTSPANPSRINAMRTRNHHDWNTVIGRTW